MSEDHSLPADEVVRAIEEAFPTTPLPDDDRLVYDSSGGHDECNQVRADFRGRRWTEVPSEILGYNTDALCFMTKEAFLYYFPAFLRKCVREYPDADLIPSEVIRLLTPGRGSSERATTLQSGLTIAQKTAVRRFLEFMRDSHPHHAVGAEEALTFSYWAVT